MKKQIVIISLTLLSTNAFGQEKVITSSSEYRPVKGKKTIEVNFMPNGFSSAPFSISYLRGRYFIADNLALRLGIGLSFNSSSDPSGSSSTTTITPTQGNAPTTNTALTRTTNYFNIQILPGIEKHFSVSERLSPYIGGELVLGITSASATYKNVYTDSQDATNNTSTEIDISGTQAQFTTSGNINFLNNRGGLNIGLNAVLGADYYITKRVYFGVELKYGFGLNSQNNSKFVTTSTSNTGTTITTTENKDGGSSFALGQSVNTAIRLGFWF